MSDPSPLLVIAAGGTGGHMFPAQALAQEMLGQGWRVQLYTDARGARYATGFPEIVSREVVPAASFGQGSLATRMLAPLTILRGIAASLSRMRRDRPECVAGFGGYPALPAIGAAVILRLPRFIHEQNGVLGRVNRLFARRVAFIACGTWPTSVPDGVQTKHVGNPVRAEVLSRAGATYRIPGAAEARIPLLVIGGSQGAGIFSQVVPAALARLPADLRGRLNLSQQVRPEDMERTTATYKEQGIKADLAGFFDDVPARLADAALVISRAGAGSIADITVVGRPSILIPYAAAMDDHQAVNASVLVSAGAAVMVRENELEPDKLAEQIAGILTDPDRAAEMAAASAAQGRPDAARRLSEAIENLVRSRATA